MLHDSSNWAYMMLDLTSKKYKCSSWAGLKFSSRITVRRTEHRWLAASSLLGMYKYWSAFQNNRGNLGFLCVLSICEVCFYQRFKASVSPLTQVEHKDKEKHQETDEDSPQSGAQHKHSWPSICVCKDQAQVDIFIETFLQRKKNNMQVSVIMCLI